MSDITSESPTNASQDQPNSVVCSLSLIVFAIVLPSFVTWLYFVALASKPAAWQQLAAGVGKGIQFLLPVWVYVFLRRRPLPLVKLTKVGVGTGVAFGALIVAVMLTLYHQWLLPSGAFEHATAKILSKVSEIGISSKFAFVVLGGFYAFIHSGLEEYYWRWFVFGQLRNRFAFVPSMVISSLGFMAHHVILLGTYFGFDSPLAYFFSFSVAVGGAFWAWQYSRTGRILGSWISHMLVDAGIFLLGYQIVFHGSP